MTVERRTGLPSFKQSIQRSIDAYREDKSSPRSVAIKLLNTKKYSKLFVKSLGIPVAETLGLHPHINEVDFASLPDQVVLKPQWGSSNNGVFLLERVGEDAWKDDMRGFEGSAAEIRAAYLDEHDRYRSINLPVMLEERFESAEQGFPVPLDYKGYCFGGDTRLLFQRDVNAGRDPSVWRYQYYDQDWLPQNGVRPAIADDVGLRAPQEKERIHEAMNFIARQIPLQFVSIDMYNTTRGIAFGEFTVHPGAYVQFSSRWDETLGQWYDDVAKPDETQIQNFVTKFRDIVQNHD